MANIEANIEQERVARLSSAVTWQDTLLVRLWLETRRSEIAAVAPDRPVLSVLTMLNAAFSEQSMAAGTEALRMHVGNRALLSVFAAAARTEADANMSSDLAAEFRDRSNVIGRILTAGGPLALRGVMARTDVRGRDSAYTMFTATGVVAARTAATGTPGSAGSLGAELALFGFLPGSLAQLPVTPADITKPQTHTGLRMSVRAGFHHPVAGDLAPGIGSSLWFLHGLLELLVDGKAAFGLNYVHVGPEEWRDYAWHGLYLNFGGHK
jgi:hypothetical protein